MQNLQKNGYCFHSINLILILYFDNADYDKEFNDY